MIPQNPSEKTRPLIALAESWTAALLRKGVMDVQPRNSGPRHEVKLGHAPGVSIECPEAEPEDFWSGIVALEDWRTTATSEEPANARAGLPALKEAFTIEKDEIGRFDSGGGAKAGARMFAAAPAMAQCDRADEIPADLVPDASTCA